jgi:hypothetical protein
LSALEARGDDVLVQYLLKQVMHGHFVLLATFFMQSQPPAHAIMIVIVTLSFSTALTRAKL